MKLTIEQVSEALNKVGVQNVEIVEDAAESDFDISEVLTAVDTARTPIIKQKVEAELTDSITSSKMGELNGMFKKMLAKTFGVSRSALDKFDTMDEAVEHVKTSFSDNFEGDKKAMDERYNELLTKFNTEKDTLNKEWEEKYNKLDSDVQTAKQIELLHEKLKEAPITWDKMVAAKETLSHAKGLYDVKVEDGQLKYYEKGTTRLALNKAGNEPLNHMDIAREYLEPRNGYAKDTRGEVPKELHKSGIPKPETNPYIEGKVNDKRSASIDAVERARAAAAEQ